MIAFLYHSQYITDNDFPFLFPFYQIKIAPPKPTTSAPVIETKPSPVIVAAAAADIKPSKSQDKNIVERVEERPSSVIEIVASKPDETNKIIDNPTPISSKVQIFSSHVEIVSDSPKPSVIKKAVEAKPATQKKSILSSKVEVKEEKSIVVVPQILSSHVEIKEAKSSIVASAVEPKTIVYSSIVEVHSSEDAEPVLQVENNIGEPEYDFLSRQPSEFAEETYRVHNIRPSGTKFTHKTRSVVAEPKKQSTNANRKDDIHPTGLVTKLGGTVVKDGATTVHETSVIGTYISGKYAQVLQSTSHIFHNNPKAKISPSSSLRILKTAAPHTPKPKQHIEPTPTRPNSGGLSENESLPIEDLNGSSPGPNLVRSSRRPAISPVSFKNRFRNRNNKDENDLQDISEAQTSSPPTTTAAKKLRNGNKPKK